MTVYERDPEATTSERGLRVPPTGLGSHYRTTSCSQLKRDSDGVSIAPSSLNDHTPVISSSLAEPKPEPVSVEPSPRPPARRSVVRAAIQRVSWSPGAWSERAKAGDLYSAQRMRGAVDTESTQCTRDEIKLVASPTVPFKSRASWFGCLAWGDDQPVPAQTPAPVRITIAVPLTGTDPVTVAGGPGTDMGPNNLLATPPPADLAPTLPLTPDLVLTPPLDSDLLPTPPPAPGPLSASQLPLNPKATPLHKRTSLPPFSRRISRTFRKTHARAYSLPSATTSSQDTSPQLQAGRARGDTVGGRRRTRGSFRESWRRSLQLGVSVFASPTTPRDRSRAGWRRSYPASPAPSSIPTSSASTLAPSPSTPGSSRRAWSWSPVTRMPSLRSPPSSSTPNPATSPTHTAALSPHLLSDTFANRHSHAQPRRHRRALSLLTGLSLSRSSAGTSGSSGLVSSRSTSTIASFGHDGDPGGGHDDFDDGDGEQPQRSLSD